MVHAAYREFCREGYAGATMNAIAEEADVAVQTLYYTFHSKAALFGEALGGAIVGFDQWREAPPDPTIAELLPWHSWWADFESAPTAHDALDVFVTGGADILGRVAPLVGALHGAAGDPEGAAVVRVSEERRTETYRELVHLIARKPPGLREGLSRPAATDIVLALFTAEAYRTLSESRGWSSSRCRRFFSDLLATQLLGPDTPDP
jgi:AcrR family transcriptional regulator